MTGVDLINEGNPPPWYPTPDLDMALWHGWPEVLRRVAAHDEATDIPLAALAERLGFAELVKDEAQ